MTFTSINNHDVLEQYDTATTRLYPNDDLTSIGKGASKRTMQVILVVDISGSMEQNGRMAKANNAVDVSLDRIREIQKRFPNVRIMVNVLSFSSMVEWMSKQPQDVDTFVYHHLRAGGMTYLADALTALENRLHKHSSKNANGFMDASKSVYPPAILFISDGGANGRDYHEELDKLLHNGYFMCAARTAIAIDDESIVSVLEDLTGNPDTVLLTKDNQALAESIESCLVNSVVVSSSTGPLEGRTATEDVAMSFATNRVDEGDDPSLAKTQSWYDLVASAKNIDFS